MRPIFGGKGPSISAINRLRSGSVGFRIVVTAVSTMLSALPERLEEVTGSGFEIDAASTTAEFASTRLQERDYAGPILNTDMKETTKRFNLAVEESGIGGYQLFSRPVVSPSLSSTAREDQVTLGSFQAWEAAADGTPEGLVELNGWREGLPLVLSTPI